MSNSQLKVKNLLNKLSKIRDKHSIWKNPLLLACVGKKLNLIDYQYIFSQYYLYNQNFTRYIAALIANCDNDYFRSKLSENLWEEGGGAEIENRHAEIFRMFLKKSLNIHSFDKIKYEIFSKLFFDEYLNFCMQQNPLEVSSFLSLGTEGIISRLYSIFREGLLGVGLKHEELLFFNIHIACDDDHALTLEEMLCFYAKEDNWFLRAKNAMLRALDLRDQFFTQLYNELQKKNSINTLVAKVSSNTQSLTISLPTNLISSINFSGNLLYDNVNNENNIGFKVERIPFNADILDPRIVRIFPNATNELHLHAHETMIVILAGIGIIRIGEQELPIKAGDIVYVPRWVLHQTRNTGEHVLQFFAVTDYGFTKLFAGNTEQSYRIKQALEKKLELK